MGMYNQLLITDYVRDFWHRFGIIQINLASALTLHKNYSDYVLMMFGIGSAKPSKLVSALTSHKNYSGFAFMISGIASA